MPRGVDAERREPWQRARQAPCCRQYLAGKGRAPTAGSRVDDEAHQRHRTDAPHGSQHSLVADHFLSGWLLRKRENSKHSVSGGHPKESLLQSQPSRQIAPQEVWVRNSRRQCFVTVGHGSRRQAGAARVLRGAGGRLLSRGRNSLLHPHRSRKDSGGGCALKAASDTRCALRLRTI